MRIALIAGEESGDILGEGLVRELRRRHPDAVIEGVCGERMRAAGCAAIGDIDELSLMGLVEVLRELPRVFRLKRRLLKHFADNPPDVFIGIDAPDFNLRMEKALRKRGVPTIHYVCPTVWAWREGRVSAIRRACNRVLCIFPFEPDFLARHGVTGVFVGHPLAEELSPTDKQQARTALGLDVDRRWVSILPGSRGSEVGPLAVPFLSAASVLHAQLPDVGFVAAMANAAMRQRFEAAMASLPGVPPVELIEGRSREVISAGDVVLTASGTATLETLLLDRPMVVAYAVKQATANIVRALRLLKTRFISMPNLIAGRPLVPELIQETVTSADIAARLHCLLTRPGYADGQVQGFAAIRDELLRNADSVAADAVDELLAST